MHHIVATVAIATNPSTSTAAAQENKDNNQPRGRDGGREGGEKMSVKWCT